MTDAALQPALRWQLILSPGQSARLRRRGVQVAILPAVAAWAVLVLLPLGPLDLQICAASPVGAGAGAVFSQALAFEWLVLEPEVAAFEWILMVVAMMLPLTLTQVDCLAARTFRSDQWRVIFAFVSSYLAVWVALAVPTILLMMLARAGLQSFGPAVGAPLIPFSLAALWWVSRFRAVALARCHYRPALAAKGVAAVRGAAGLGLTNGVYCAATCLPLMLAVQIAGGGVLGMALLGLMILAERAAHRPNPKGAALVLIVFAAGLSLI